MQAMLTKQPQRNQRRSADRPCLHGGGLGSSQMRNCQRSVCSPAKINCHGSPNGPNVGHGPWMIYWCLVDFGELESTWQINAKFSLKHPSRMDIPAPRKSRASLDQEGNWSLVGFVHLSSGKSPLELQLFVIAKFTPSKTRNSSSTHCTLRQKLCNDLSFIGVVLRIAKAFEDLPSVVADADRSPARAVVSLKTTEWSTPWKVKTPGVSTSWNLIDIH